MNVLYDMIYEKSKAKIDANIDKCVFSNPNSSEFEKTKAYNDAIVLWFEAAYEILTDFKQQSLKKSVDEIKKSWKIVILLTIIDLKMIYTSKINLSQNKFLTKMEQFMSKILLGLSLIITGSCLAFNMIIAIPVAVLGLGIMTSGVFNEITK